MTFPSPSVRGVTRALALIAFASPAFAQDNTAQNDLEYRDTTFEQKKKVVVHGRFESEWHETDNLDFRPLDESSDQAILDSDDRSRFAFTGLAADIGAELDDRTRLLVGMSHRGLWGNDQLGGTNQFGGVFYFTAAAIEYKLPSEVVVTIGRKFVELGGIGGSREYILSDHLDGVWIDVPLAEKGTLSLMPINVASASANPDDITLISYVSQSAVQSFNFRGDRMTRRLGGQLILDGLKEGLDVRAHAFYTDIGSLGSGSDISYNGRLGNFTDNDWVANAGVRGSLEAGAVTPFATFDFSTGIDRKELVAGDVNTTGFAGSGGLVVDTRDEEAEVSNGVFAELSGFYAVGPAFLANGMQHSHGYVGMKARHVGGTLGNRYMGLHPTAYVGMFGIDDNQHDVARKSGTLTAHARVGYDTGKADVLVSYWFLQDTGISGIRDFDNIADPPYGYSRTAMRAQERLGRTLGHEVNLDGSVEISEAVRLRANAAVFLPGEFYAIPVGRIAGDQLGGTAVAWAITGGTSVRF